MSCSDYGISYQARESACKLLTSNFSKLIGNCRQAHGSACKAKLMELHASSEERAGICIQAPKQDHGTGYKLEAIFMEPSGALGTCGAAALDPCLSL